MGNCKTIAVINQKGGVGKTTTALNLGAALTKRGNRVLLVDADPQGSLTVSMGIKNPDELDVTLSALLEDAMADREIRTAGVLLESENMHLIPSNIELSGTENNLSNAVICRERMLKTVLEPYRLRGGYDYIFIDCMPSLGILSLNALVAADGVIIPTQPNFLSTKGLNQLLTTIGMVKKHGLNDSLTVEGILLTMVDGRTNNARRIIEALRSTVKDRLRVFDTEIPNSVRVMECGQLGESIFAHDRNGKVAAAYENLAKEVENIERDRFGADRVR